MANNNSGINTTIFYGNRDRDEGSDTDEVDFEGSDSEDYVPSEVESSGSDFSRDSEPSIVGEDIPDAPDMPLSSANLWTPVSGTSLNTFVFDEAPTFGIERGQSTFRPIDAFRIMVTEEIFDLIVNQTNLNANNFLQNNTITRKSRTKEWVGTTVAEIKKFLGLVIYMGIVKYPSISHYWRTDQFYKNSFVPQVMSRNRFQLILKFIHFSDNSLVGSDRLGKVSGLLAMLEHNFVNARRPGEVLAVDESMIPWRGRLQFRQYNPGKSHKYGVKVYKLCDPSGYTYTSSVYAGKNESLHQRGKPTTTTSHSTQIVLDLAEKYLDHGRTLATDNFYTSVSLAKMLLARKTHLIGTLRKNRIGNPKEVTMAKLKRSEIIGRENSSIVISKWKDKREVLMLSTKHGLEQAPTGKKTRQGEEITKLKVIIDYNHAKQGIDISDQMACYFTPLRKTIRWYHKIAFEYLLSTAVVNALVIYKSTKNMTILEFRQSICEALCDIKLDQQPSTSNPIKHKLKEFETRDSTNRKTRKRCLSCYENLAKIEGRSVAAKKAKKVSTFCSDCEGSPAFCLECFTKHQ